MSSYSTTELKKDSKAPEKANAYVIPKPDPKHPDRFHRDDAGALVRLAQGEVVRASDPVRAAAEAEKRRGEKEKVQATAALTDTEKAAWYRTNINRWLEWSTDDAKSLLVLSAGNIAVGEPFGTAEEWAKTNKLASKLASVIEVNEPESGEDF